MSTSGGICLSLQGSAMCPEFATSGYKAFIQAGMPITTISTFDSSVQQGYGPVFKDIVTKSTCGGYNCRGWNGDNLRYMYSVLCAYHMGLGFQYGASGSLTPCNSAIPRPFSLCHWKARMSASPSSVLFQNFMMKSRSQLETKSLFAGV
ncbi:hypothetical protein BC830DRAFT_763099 [Chytriomyces sp. MP71]|nr:hypothetical protein BC830DRAFT_763099 [Chytriomyces sp. MP71]